MELEVGMDAPNFTLLDEDEKEHTLSSYKGKAVVLYFYPKDDTPGCTKEACGFRDAYSEYEKLNSVIFGVSADDPKSHAKFIKKFDLPFTLLADTEKEVVNMYNVWGMKQMFGKEYEGIHRVTFIIDKEGKIAKIFENVRPDEHSEEVIEFLKSLN